MPPKKRTSYSVEESVLETIIDEIGNDWITDQWIAALQGANRKTDQETRALFDSFWIHVYKTRISSLITPLLKEDIYQQWLGFYESQNRCLISTAQTMNGYAVVSCRTTRNESTKLQLHIVANYIWMGEIPTLHSSHYCHQKLCLEHVCHEEQKLNNCRNHCRCYQLIDNVLVWNCIHSPKCLIPGPLAFYGLQ